MEPRTLSSWATNCCASGRRGTIFRPRIEKLRPSNDISKLLSGGPTAWEASEALSSSRSGWEPSIRLICSGAAPGIGTRSTFAVGSSFPIGLRPLNSNRARPSKKLRWLKTAYHRRSVARLDATNVDAAIVEDRVGRGDVAPVGVIEAQK